MKSTIFMIAVTFFGLNAKALEAGHSYDQNDCEIQSTQAYIGVIEIISNIEQQIAHLKPGTTKDQVRTVNLRRKSLEASLQRLNIAKRIIVDRIQSAECRGK